MIAKSVHFRSSSTRHLFLVLLWTLSAVLSVPAKAVEETLEHSEIDVKAAFIYKFLSFAQWPPKAFANASTPLTIGVLGSEDMMSRLVPIVAGRTITGRPLAVRSLKYGESLDGINALYIGSVSGSRLSELTARGQRQSILTICDADDGIDRGCVIDFLSTEGRIRFDVSLEAAQLSQLELSSRLLSVAHDVKAAAK